jgi:hypothetical protein
VADAKPVSEVYYQFDHGPGCAYYFSEADYNRFQMTGGNRVVVVNGQFPVPAAMPPIRNLSSVPKPETIPMDCIDTAHSLSANIK